MRKRHSYKRLTSTQHAHPTSSSTFTMEVILLIAILACFLICVSSFRTRRKRLSPAPYPPTPPGHFLLGNLRDIQHKTLRYHYDELAKTYGTHHHHNCALSLTCCPGLGEIFHISALGQHIIVLNTEEAAYELFTSRSAIYSDRPQFAMVDL